MARHQFLGEAAENSRLDKRAREAGFSALPLRNSADLLRTPTLSPANKRSRVERHVTMGGVCQRLPDGGLCRRHIDASIHLIKQGRAWTTTIFARGDEMGTTL